MATLLFNAVEVKEQLDHAKAAIDWEQSWFDLEANPPKKPEPCLVLVHDVGGVYLTSNGKPGMPSDPTTEKQDQHSKVAYALGCNPNKDPRFLETGRELVGGEDFSDYIPVRYFDVVEENPHCDQLALRITPKEYHIRARFTADTQQPVAV